MFQLGLGVLKFNEAALMEATDDDEVLHILKVGFSTFDDDHDSDGVQKRIIFSFICFCFCFFFNKNKNKLF